jgi:osomolarity two-component system response regulator SKN7
MIDVLAKPFTRDGMVRILRKHLTRMLKDPQAPSLIPDDMGQSGVAGAGPGPPTTNVNQGYVPASTMAMANLAAAAAGNPTVKFEHTPIQSPSAASSWHSPGQMHQAAPNLDSGGYMGAVGSGSGGMAMTPGGTQRPPPQSQPGQYANYMTAQQIAETQAMRMAEMGQMGGLAGGDDRPEKRQRLYGPSLGQGRYMQ